MGRLSTAFRAFFGALFYAEIAARVNQALLSQVALVTDKTIDSQPLKPADRVVESKPQQSEAITLLATLQREARLIDFLKEDLSNYSDEQIGAAVREIHRDSSSVLNRLFAIQPILHENEGDPVDVPVGFDASRYRLTGQLTGSAPFHGTLRHHGWEATRCELPVYSGGASSTKIVAPAEVEIFTGK